jgi:hypothetical protein
MGVSDCLNEVIFHVWIGLAIVFFLIVSFIRMCRQENKPEFFWLSQNYLRSEHGLLKGVFFQGASSMNQMARLEIFPGALIIYTLNPF